MINIKEHIKNRLRTKLNEMVTGSIDTTTPKETIGAEKFDVRNQRQNYQSSYNQPYQQQTPTYRSSYDVPPYGTPGVLIPPYDNWNASPIQFYDDNGVLQIITNPYLRNTPSASEPTEDDYENLDINDTESTEEDAEDLPIPYEDLPINPKIFDFPPDYIDSEGRQIRVITNEDGTITVIVGPPHNFTVYPNLPPNFNREGLQQIPSQQFRMDQNGNVYPGYGWNTPLDYLYPGWNPFTGEPPTGFDRPAYYNTPAGDFYYRDILPLIRQ